LRAVAAGAWTMRACSCMHGQPIFLSHRPPALSAGNSCRLWRRWGGIRWSCGRSDLSSVAVCVWMSLFDFLAGIFIRRRHPLPCESQERKPAGSSRGFLLGGRRWVLCFLHQRLCVLYCCRPVEELSVLI
jgi:hypothetical protein